MKYSSTVNPSLKFEMTGAGTGLDALSIRHDIQHSQRPLPALPSRGHPGPAALLAHLAPGPVRMSEREQALWLHEEAHRLLRHAFVLVVAILLICCC